MSTRNERFEQIEANWFDADANLQADRNKAATPAAKAEVDKNHATAFETWTAATKAGLANQGAAIEATYQQLKAANAAVKKSREDLEAFPALLGKLNTATSGATTLLETAG